MSTNWTVTNSNRAQAFDTARDASAFLKANMGRRQSFELDAPLTLSVEDRKYFGAMLIEAIIRPKVMTI